jgi:hypothetical protein
MLFSVEKHLDEGLSHETLLTLKVGSSLICLVGTWRPTVTLTEKLILSMKTLTRSKTS